MFLSNSNRHTIDHSKAKGYELDWQHFAELPDTLIKETCKDIRHFFPQPIISKEHIVLLGTSSTDQRRREVVFLDKFKGKYLCAFAHEWQNDLWHSPVTNGGDVWYAAQDHICHRSLFNPQHSLNIPFEQQWHYSAFAAPLWFSHPQALPHEGYLCLLFQQGLLCYDRSCNVRAAINIEWRQPLTFMRSPCASWPWLLAVTSAGEYAVVKFADLNGKFEIIKQGNLLNPNTHPNTLFSAPLYANGRFFIESLQSTPNNHRQIAQVTYRLLSLVPDGDVQEIFTRQISMDQKQIDISLHYPPLCGQNLTGEFILTSSHINDQALQLYNINTQIRNIVQLPQPINIPKQRAAICGQKLYLTQTSMEGICCNLQSSTIDSFYLVNGYIDLLPVSTPVVINGKMYLYCRDRFLSVNISNSNISQN
jgi:hypothetical protein